MSISIEVKISEPISLPTKFGNFLVQHIKAKDREGVILSSEKQFSNPVLVRIQSSCLFSESFLANNCDCSLQLQETLRIISAEGGVLIYLYEEGRGAGLEHKIKAIKLQQEFKYDTASAYKQLGVQSDVRNHEIAASVLSSFLGENPCIELLTNNPSKVTALKEAGIKVLKRRPLVCNINDTISSYLDEKSKFLGHILGHD
jgi:GTP cyclohydrolase II